jgi:hypothetical protein
MHTVSDTAAVRAAVSTLKTQAAGEQHTSTNACSKKYAAALQTLHDIFAEPGVYTVLLLLHALSYYNAIINIYYIYIYCLDTY